MHLKLYITKNGILLSTRDLGIEPETHDEGLFMWSRISSLTALNGERYLPNLLLLTAHFDNNRYKERVGSAACVLAVVLRALRCWQLIQSMLVINITLILCMVQVRIWFHPIFSFFFMFYG